MRAKKYLNTCCKAWLRKKSFLTCHPYYTHPSNYLFAMAWPSARLYKGFICHMSLFQTSRYVINPHLEGGFFFLLPWALPCESCTACLSLSLALQPASTQLRFLHGAMGGCRFGALLVAVGLNSGRHPTWRSLGAAPVTPSQERARHSVFSGATCRQFIDHGRLCASSRNFPFRRSGRNPQRPAKLLNHSLFCSRCCWYRTVSHQLIPSPKM